MFGTDLLRLFLERHVGNVHLLFLVITSLPMVMCSGGGQETGGQETMQPGVSQVVPQAYLKASNTDAGDWFGAGVAVFGDTLVVNARTEDSAATGINGNQTDNSMTDSGAVYVFTRASGVWTQQAYLKASDTNADARFGYWVDLEGDTLVVGAPISGDTGTVYVFTRTGGVWSQQAALKASNARAGDFFGSSVAISGDTVVVGARFEDSGAQGIDGNQTDDSAPDSGAAYVFTRTGSVWSQQAYVKASNTRAGDRFGFSVDLSGNTLLVGAPSEDGAAVGIGGDQANTSTPDSGAAYVFTRNGSVWIQEAYVKSTNTGSGDGFGNGVAIAGDTFLVGAPFEDSAAVGIEGNQADNSAPDSGAAYVFSKTGGAWSQEAYLKSSNTGVGDFFAFHVAMTPQTLLIGAHQEDSADQVVGGNGADNSAPDSGAVYVFTRQSGVWSQLAYVKASNAGANNWFGAALAVDGNTVAVGANKENRAAMATEANQADHSAPESGAAYVFQLQ